MLKRYNLVPWEKVTLPLEEAKLPFRYHCTYGWTLQSIFIYTKIMPTKRQLE
jgi:hypothetical protein